MAAAALHGWWRTS
ncbi:hypothetical protein KCP70_25290 [Salmonella enterica subsp. enterica]|nr:hypothetical protein KCP70_25290 [Salmonella enterica subsp. enterica]